MSVIKISETSVKHVFTDQRDHQKALNEALKEINEAGGKEIPQQTPVEPEEMPVEPDDPGKPIRVEPVPVEPEEQPEETPEEQPVEPEKVPA